MPTARLLAGVTATITLAVPANVPAQSSRLGDFASLRAGFGAAVAVTGDEVLVGEPNNRFRSGVVYSYRRDGTGVWQQAMMLTGPDSATGDRFGRSLAVRADLLLVGSDPDRGSSTGAVHLYGRNGNGPWTHRQLLKPTDADSAASFGAAMVLGNGIAAIGAPQQGGTGVVYLFEPSTTGWRQVARLAPVDTAGVAGFGSAIAMVGDRMLIGAPASGNGRGIVFPFARTESGWVPATPLRQGSNADSTTAFGSSLAIIGDQAYVGAPGAVGGSGLVLRLSYDNNRTAWRVTGAFGPFDGVRGGRFGATISADTDGFWVGSPGGRRGGKVDHYRIETDGMVAVQRINPDDPSDARGFGQAFAVQGDLAAVGIPGSSIGAGRALILERHDGKWESAGPVESPPESFAAITGPKVDCNSGSAALWDCNRVDLVSFLPVSAIGGVRGMRLNDLWGWTDSTSGREYVIIGRSDGTSFVDMTDAANPRYLGDLPMTPGARAAVWRDIKVYRDHAYIVADGAGQHGVQVFDLHRLRNIAQPKKFAPDYLYTGIASAHNIVINEETGYGYVVGASSGGTTCGGGLHMLDLHDPGKPTFAGCFSDGVTGRSKTGYTHDAQCVVYRGPDEDYQGHEICFAANETALSLADVTDKKNPVSIATVSYPNVAYAHQGWLSEDQRYFFSNDEIDEANGSEPHTRTLVWDFADLDDPVLAHEYFATTTQTDHNLYVRGHYMYQSNTGAGFRVLDVSDPLSPREVAYFDTDRDGSGGGTWSNYPFFRSGVIPVTGGFAGIFFVRPRLEVVP